MHTPAQVQKLIERHHAAVETMTLDASRLQGSLKLVLEHVLCLPLNKCARCQQALHDELGRSSSFA